MRIFFETMESKHLDDVLEIEELSYGEHHWNRDSFVSEIKNDVSNYVCALVENEDGQKIPAAYCGVWTILEEAHITTLAVHPNYRGKKIAQALLIHQFENFYKRKIKYVTLEVRKSNESAIKLYEKFGFKSLGVRKNYYQNNNEDALIMWTSNIFSQDFQLLYNERAKEVKALSATI